MERLATGKRINSAVDDAAGLAIAARMESQISGLNQAVRNANDAISLVSTAEGALQETTAILQRIRELSIQSAGGAPSNADRVNLNKEVIQLQEELARIANTTRSMVGYCNGSFVDTDLGIGQSNNEEITVSIGDIRPERIGAFTQRTVPHVGLVSSGASLEAIDNGVNQQTLVVQVGNEVPRTISINKGDDARNDFDDKINQAGAQVNSTAVTTSNVYIDGYGSFSFKISSSSAPGHRGRDHGWCDRGLSGGVSRRGG